MKMILIYAIIAVFGFAGSFILTFILGLIFQAMRKKMDAKRLASGAFGASIFFSIVITISGGMYLFDQPRFREEIADTSLFKIDWSTLISEMIRSQEAVVEREDEIFIETVTEATNTVVPVSESTNTVAPVSETNRRYPDRRPPDQRRPDQRGPQETDRSAQNLWANRGGGDSATGADYVIDASVESIYTSLYEWKYKNSSLRKKQYKVAVELSVDNLQAAQTYLDKMNRLYYQWNRELFTEVGTEMNADPETVYAAVCQAIYEDDSLRFTEIIEGFQAIFTAEGMNNMDQLYFVITFFQNITYRLPGNATDLLPPSLCLAEKYGDCDTKSMLAYMVLDGLGFDVVMMASADYAHAMLGVNATATGDYLEYDGKRYYFVEMTYPDWWLGELDSSCNNPRYWYAFKLDV